ncbi:HNH endonuclease [Streptomyces erythrochromogenes]|uniref:HNH endonuclease n=1 Tax=Streptomyces erythrochromogenes TaxID=285574 RepID=UPI0036A701C5
MTRALTVAGLGLNFPHAVQAARVLRYLTDLKTGTVSRQSVYAITDLTSHQASHQRLGRLTRSQWTIENRQRFVRDTTFCEDASKICTGHGPENTATLRNLAINTLRQHGHRDSGAFLPKFSWTGIVRHQLVKGGSSPDDPALTGYWQDRRRRKAPPPMDKTSLVLAVRQGLCPLCKQALIAGAEYEPDSPREWINWFAASKKMLHKHDFTYRRHGGSDERNNLRLVHSECHRQHHAGDGERTTSTC